MLSADRLVQPLVHRRLVIRFVTLLAVAAAVFVIAWTLAYLLLPEGFLRGRTAGGVLAGETAADAFWVEWLRILAINLTVAVAVFVLPDLLRTPRGIALGNVAALVLVTMAAIVTGTNSFAVQTGSSESLAPSLEILAHPGPYELMAYLLATASAYGIGRWQLEGWGLRSKARTLPSQPLRRTEMWVGLALAALAIVTTAAWEARDILDAVG